MLQPKTEGLAGALEEILRRFAPKNHTAVEFTPQTRLMEEVGIDSPRMIDIVLEIEDRFGFTIADEDAQNVRTFGELMELVQDHA